MLFRSQAEEVTFSYRLLPNRDVIMESTEDVVSSTRVLEDRGMIANSGGRLSLRPQTETSKKTSSIRYTTGPAAADGSFVAEMRVLNPNIPRNGAQEQEEESPEDAIIRGMTLRAVIEKTGQVRPNSFDIRLDDAQLSEALQPSLQQLKPMFESMLTQEIGRAHV